MKKQNFDYLNIAMSALFSHLSDEELVKQFNDKAEVDNSKEAYEIIRRNLKVIYKHDKLIML